MSQTIESFVREWPWHCGVLDEQNLPTEIADLAIGKDGWIDLFDGKDWR